MEKKRYNIKKEDRVMVLSGKDSGKMGKVLKILPKKDRIVVEKVNMIKRHTKPGGTMNAKGGIVEKEGSIPISNVSADLWQMHRPDQGWPKKCWKMDAECGFAVNAAKP